MMLKKYWYFMGTSKFGGKYGSICGQIWVPDHDSQFAPLWTEIPLLETVGGCPNTVLSKDLNNPSQSKTKIRNWTKKTSVTGKTHNGQKKMSIRFSRYIYIYVPDQSIDTMQQHKFRGFLHFTQDGRTWTSVVACWWCIFPASGRFLFTHGVHGNNHGTRGFINHNVQSWGYDIVLI